MELYLLNGRGGPWFSAAGQDSIEDSAKIKLYCKAIDPVTKTIELTTKQNANMLDNRVPTATLHRRAHLDRFQWCLKGVIGWFTTPSDYTSSRKSLRYLDDLRRVVSLPTRPAFPSASMFTLVTPDSELVQPVTNDGLDPSALNIASHHMEMEFMSTDDPMPQPVERTVVNTGNPQGRQWSNTVPATLDTARRQGTQRSRSQSQRISTLSTFEMIMSFQNIDRGPQTDVNGATTSVLDFRLLSIRISYSYLFQQYDEAFGKSKSNYALTNTSQPTTLSSSPTTSSAQYEPLKLGTTPPPTGVTLSIKPPTIVQVVNYGNYTVHSPTKVSRLLSCAEAQGLSWNSTYWSFDVVLHWLTHPLEESHDEHDVIDYLIEHENLCSASSTKQRASPSVRRLKRFFVSDSII